MIIYLVALFHLASIIACSGTFHLEPIRGYNNNSNPFNSNKCEENCIDELIKCLSGCDTVECETECRRAEVDCTNGKQ